MSTLPSYAQDLGDGVYVIDTGYHLVGTVAVARLLRSPRDRKIESIMEEEQTVFKVSDPKLLDGLKPGDKVRFAASSVNGNVTVTAIEPVR